jgi:hypothetical protein
MVITSFYHDLIFPLQLLLLLASTVCSLTHEFVWHSWARWDNLDISRCIRSLHEYIYTVTNWTPLMSVTVSIGKRAELYRSSSYACDLHGQNVPFLRTVQLEDARRGRSWAYCRHSADLMYTIQAKQIPWIQTVAWYGTMAMVLCNHDNKRLSDVMSVTEL